MSIIEAHWENLSEEKWEKFARNFLRCENQEGEGEDCQYWGELSVRIGLWGSDKALWHFLLLTLSLAETERELAGIGAGPIEYLLGRFGPEYIERVENEVAINPKFATAIKDCYQYSMTDEVWERVQKLQSR
jgi:hypothetical protein